MSINEKDVSNEVWCTGKLCEGNGGKNERRAGERVNSRLRAVGTFGHFGGYEVSLFM